MSASDCWTNGTLHSAQGGMLKHVINLFSAQMGLLLLYFLSIYNVMTEHAISLFTDQLIIQPPLLKQYAKREIFRSPNYTESYDIELNFGTYAQYFGQGLQAPINTCLIE